MDTPGSDNATESSNTSTPDTSSSESPSAQIMTGLEDTVSSKVDDGPVASDDDDSVSDVSMAAETEDEDDDGPSISTIQINPGMHVPQVLAAEEPPTSTTNKRKYSASTEDTPEDDFRKGPPSTPSPLEYRKRLKPDVINMKYRTPEGHLHQDKSLLPAEIWHYIFTFIPPRELGLLLRVNKSFNASLDPSSLGNSVTPLSKSALQLLNPDSIWQASRRRHYWSLMPSPLQGKSELDMWKLACSFSCQYCGKKRPESSVPSDSWHPGPGENGVVPIWSFGVRACGPCLQERTSKEIELFLSSSVPSQLMTALPFIFLTTNNHVIPLSTLQNGQQPPSTTISKVFFQPQIEEIKKEFTDVTNMGSATAEEWLKGLEDRGKERKLDASRWERWEGSGGITRMRTERFENRTSSINSNVSTPAITMSLTYGAPVTNGHLHSISGRSSAIQLQPHGLPSIPPVPQSAHPSLLPSIPPRFDSPSQNGFAAYPPRSYPQTKQERSKEEVAALKLARRAEIERRCMLLDPPLTAGVLAHMGSFQAAIQIIQPLNDGAWEVLKPRLLSQREDAEQREKERIAQTRVVQEQIKDHQDQQSKSDTKDPFDRDWDIQAPLRARIGGYADETIRDGWADGDKVNKENCATFAAEVLIYVRKRFYAEVAKDEAALRATGREPQIDPPEGPSSRKLTLENMKWVFDTKIKPHTEQYRKELFLCNDCENSKYYGFEGVIQHYAAKHTNALSMGSIVVHWKSEWPEYPPFNPEPHSGKNNTTYYAIAQTASVPYASTAPQQPFYGGGYAPAPGTVPLQASNQHGYQESPGPYYGHPQFGEQYPGQQNGPYAPPQPYQDPNQSYQAPQYSMPPPIVSNLGYSEPSQDYSQQGYGTQYPPATQAYYNPPQVAQYPTSVAETASQQPAYPPQTSQYGYSYSQPPVPQPLPQSVPQPAPQYAHSAPPIKTEEYKTQLLDVAKNARDVWDSINGLKDIPGSVKVQTIIFHVIKRSRFIFPEDPPLAMIVDGLSSNKDMRKVRNVNGLVCKACTLGMAGSTSGPQKKHYSFPQLASHFHTVHEQGAPKHLGQFPDWTQDMVELPDQARLSAIANAPGITDQKLKLISEAVPEIIAPPQQNLESNGHPDQLAGYPEQATGYGYPADQDLYGPPPSKDNHDRYYTSVDNGKPADSGSMVYDNTQYDPRNPRDSRESHPEDRPPKYRVIRSEDHYPPTYQERHDLAEARMVSPSPQYRPVEGYSRVVSRVTQEPLYRDEQPRYRDEDAEYRVRRPAIVYEDRVSSLPEREHGEANLQAYLSNRHGVASRDHPPREVRYLPAEGAATQQNQLFDVVAKISQQAKQAREMPAKEEAVDAGSEDGELRAAPAAQSAANRTQQSAEANNAAERFLNEFLPGDEIDKVPAKASETELHPRRYDDPPGDNIQRVYQPPGESRRQFRDVYEDGERLVSSSGPSMAYDEPISNGYVLRDRSPIPKQARAYAYDERYEHAAMRERSPELVDRRFKLNTVVYRDERQGSHGMHRTPSSRYARYESVRLEHDRARSRSPVYVKMGSQPGQYRERSPGAHPPYPEPIYRSRTPPVPTEPLQYERAPRPEYYRVYADGPQPRQPQYVEAYEIVRVSDPENGDYMIRRPVRREPESIYAPYEGGYSRKPVYEAREPIYEQRAPAPRSSAAPAHFEEPQYEEYDPRHPAPPPAAMASVRQVRYQ